jgi:hypothetical protein
MLCHLQRGGALLNRIVATQPNIANVGSIANVSSIANVVSEQRRQMSSARRSIRTHQARSDPAVSSRSFLWTKKLYFTGIRVILVIFALAKFYTS